MLVSLYVIQGNDQGNRFELCAADSRIGREPDNLIQLHDSEVSRHHARIEYSDGEFRIIDDDSANGTYVNGSRVDNHVLRSGDQIQIGRTRLLFAASFPEVETAKPLEYTNHTPVSFLDQGTEQHLVECLPSTAGEAVHSRQCSDSKDWSTKAESHLRMMYHMMLVTSQTLDIGVLLHRILDLIFEWIEVDRGSIMLFDPESYQLIPQATRVSREGQNDTTDASEVKLAVNKSIVGYVLKRREGVLTNDVQHDVRWKPQDQGVREIICVPMMGRYGLVGIIYLDTFQRIDKDDADAETKCTTDCLMETAIDSPPPTAAATSTVTSLQTPRLTPDHLRLMAAIAHQAALAVEDTRYYKGMIQGERLAAVGQTVTTLSHHIKNILQGISGGSHLIQIGLDRHNEEMIRKGWDIVEKNQSRISNLILDMLTFSKEREPAYELRSIQIVLQDIVELLHARAGEQNIDVRLEIKSAVPKFFFDMEQIHRAITNIILNGIDAVSTKLENENDHGNAPENGNHPKHPSREGVLSQRLFVDPALRNRGFIRIGLGIDQQPAMVEIDIDDNGPGIPKSQRAALFRPFHSKKKGRGTGLGLSVALKIVEEHGGTIRIEDSDLGGACFKIALPFKLNMEKSASKS